VNLFGAESAHHRDHRNVVEIQKVRLSVTAAGSSHTFVCEGVRLEVMYSWDTVVVFNQRPASPRDHPRPDAG